MKTIYLLTLLILTFGAGIGQPIFDNPITGNNPNTSNPYITGQTINTNITVSGIGRGAGINGNIADDRYNANGWNTPSIDLTAYFEFTLTPNASIGINFISFVYTSQANNATISNFAFRSSMDGYTADIGTPNVGGTTIDLSAPIYQNITAPITFRFYAWGADITNRTFSINNFTFNGVVNVLPVNISYLNGTKQNSSHNLNWKVNCTSSQTVTMAVERSSETRNFKTITTITANGTRCLQPFSYTDNNALAGNNYYRLKTVDENGKIIYSTVVLIINKETGFEIAGILPSLINNSTAVLNASAAKKMQLTVVVTDMLGKQVQLTQYNLAAGSNQILMNFSNLAAGAYQLAAYTAQGELKTIRFIKQ
jgi:hypothetical protein